MKKNYLFDRSSLFGSGGGLMGQGMPEEQLAMLMAMQGQGGGQQMGPGLMPWNFQVPTPEYQPAPMPTAPQGAQAGGGQPRPGPVAGTPQAPLQVPRGSNAGTTFIPGEGFVPTQPIQYPDGTVVRPPQGPKLMDILGLRR